MIRQKLQFWGKVQNVGFRYSMTMKARSLGCTGWVKNESDGSVKAEVQGEPDAIKEVVKYLKKDKYIRIRFVNRQNIPLIEGERDFSETW
ncbi:MAG: acylphosphatase [Bacillota bacterium]|nr:acylphosphatase [Bacillota bacterium]